MEEKSVLINGARLNYYERGEGFPILLVHGWGARGGITHLRFQELLAEHGFKVFVLNLPGFGGSDFPAFGWGMKQYVRAINDFVEKIGLEKFHLFGHSMGGAMAIRFAATYPEKVKILFLCSPGIFLNVSSLKMIIFSIGFSIFLFGLKILRFPFTLIYNLLRRIKPSWQRLILLRKLIKWLETQHHFFFREEKVMARIFKDIIKNEDSVSLLMRLEAPTLVIWGGMDILFTFLTGYLGYIFLRYTAYIPNHTLKMIPDAGHSPQNEAPEELARLVLEFIKKTSQ